MCSIPGCLEEALRGNQARRRNWSRKRGNSDWREREGEALVVFTKTQAGHTLAQKLNTACMIQKGGGWGAGSRLHFFVRIRVRDI